MKPRPRNPPPALPKARHQVVIHEHRLDLEQLRKLELRDGDVVCLPADTPADQARQLADALGPDGLEIRVLIVLGDLQSLDEAAMNAAGWYRK